MTMHFFLIFLLIHIWYYNEFVKSQGYEFNIYLNFRVYVSIFTEGKNFTSGSREDHEVTVSEPPKMIGPELLR
jgi:hypothetical protein